MSDLLTTLCMQDGETMLTEALRGRLDIEDEAPQAIKLLMENGVPIRGPGIKVSYTCQALHHIGL